LRVFLGLVGLLFLPYGLYCFFQPAYLSEVAGLGLGSTTASTEVRAMYGGLQAAVGCFALAALLRSHLERPALLCVAFLAGGLFLGRLGGILFDGGVSPYTGGAVILEIALASTSVFLLSRRPAQTAPA
jgi:hypothetical protein